jgi:hypothetical protein
MVVCQQESLRTPVVEYYAVEFTDVSEVLTVSFIMAMIALITRMMEALSTS